MMTLTLALLLAQDPPAMPKPAKEHEWLKGFEGEWTTAGEAVAEPGKPAVQLKGSASGRSLGGYWALVENRGDFFGTPFTGLLTLGWDAEAKKYHGTWVDSLGATMWRYTGTLDAAGKVLTLDTQGPCPQTGKVEKFQEKIELQGKDSWIFTSGMFVDGKLQPFLKMTYTRKS